MRERLRPVRFSVFLRIRKLCSFCTPVAIYALAMMSGPSSFAADSRNAQMFLAWVASSSSQAEVQKLHQQLTDGGVGDLYPVHQILRTASAWKKCEKVGAQPFSLPATDAEREGLIQTLALLRELKSRNLLPQGEIVSGYRAPKAFNKCAGGAENSAHLYGSAFDFAHSPDTDPGLIRKLCAFWRQEGKKWRMGLSVYAISGRIHIDTHRHRTWASKGHAPTCLK